MRVAAIVSVVMFVCTACGNGGGGGPDDGLPDALPFAFERADVGDPLSSAEIEMFTREVTGFWKQVEFFPWVLRTSHGVHESTGKPDYMVWWGGVQPIREGDTVRFYHVDPDGGGHNIMIPTPRVLVSAIGGHLLTGDPHMAEVAEQYCKGITATMLGMVHDQDDSLDHLMARNVAAFNHEYLTEEGHPKQIDYSGWYTSYRHWNTCRFNYPDNPTWGSMWITNMRSKDDVPHIFMAVPAIRYAASRAQSDEVRTACGQTLDYLQRFSRDIVDFGYRIRSKDEHGEPFIPGYTGDEELDQAAGDLASFVMWDDIVPNAECNAKRASALIGYGHGDDLDCGKAAGNDYERMAVSTHYYNHDIVRFFHLAHIANALVEGDDRAAETLLAGMAERIDGYLATPDEDLPRSRSEWENDIALLCLRSAAYGLPLTSREARLIQEKWGMGAERHAAWAYWNLWDPVHEDGELPHRPYHRDGDINWARIQDMALLLEYCWSPLRNPAGARFVDCDLISDPARW